MYQESEHKHYSNADKDRSDPRSKRESAAFLQQIDPKFKLLTPLDAQPEMYSKWDYTIHYDSKPITVETEQKLKWTTNDGTFFVSGRIRPTVDVSGRKWKSEAQLFIMLNGTFDALCFTEMKNVLAAPMSGKNTSVGTFNEFFYNVDPTLFRFYYKQSNTWTLYRS